MTKIKGERKEKKKQGSIRQSPYPTVPWGKPRPLSHYLDTPQKPALRQDNTRRPLTLNLQPEVWAPHFTIGPEWGPAISNTHTQIHTHTDTQTHTHLIQLSHPTMQWEKQSLSSKIYHLWSDEHWQVLMVIPLIIKIIIIIFMFCGSFFNMLLLMQHSSCMFNYCSRFTFEHWWSGVLHWGQKKN